MIQIDLTQYSETARRDLCMALYRMVERHNPRGDEEPGASAPEELSNHQPEGCWN